MCGIAGILGTTDYTDAVRRMVQQMYHRGPDDQGLQTIMTGGSCLTLGSTRLAIIDVSQAGHMPMTDSATGNWIVYNGEVYNFLELRCELEGKGVQFHSHTDTEVILAAYNHWGTDCILRFRGMFAFVIWDQAKQELFLVRDRVGKKPLYYTHASDGTFLFGSEVRTLLASQLIARHLSPTALEVFLFNGFVVAPTTMIKHVHSLLPAHWMRVRTDGQIVETRRYWQPPYDRPANDWSPAKHEEAVADVRARFEEAVTMRLISDVPLGAFLSGGLDSSTIVALMARVSQHVRTFSIIFDEAGFDESPYARWVAQRFHTEHTDVRIRRTDFSEWLPDALAAMDQPTLDGVNTYCVARATRASGTTVALSGLGGDELFGGYQEFTLAPRLAWFTRLTRNLPTPVSNALKRWSSHQTYHVAGPLKAMELLLSPVTGGTDTWIATYQTLAMLFPMWTRQSLYANGTFARDSNTWYGLPQQFIQNMYETDSFATPSGAISRLSSALFLSERTLRDTDTMSMAVSLEVRAPFTDHAFIESMWRIPSSVRCAGTPYKPLQWEIAKPYLGPDYPHRKKQGFTFPLANWLHERAFFDLIEETLTDRQRAQDVGMHSDTVNELLATFWHKKHPIHWTNIWALFVLFRWCEHNRVSLA